MDKLTSDNISNIMSDVDKCKVLIELLEHKNGDNDWQLSQTLSVIKDLLSPAILELVEISDYLWEKEQEQMQKQPNIPLKVA